MKKIMRLKAVLLFLIGAMALNSCTTERFQVPRDGKDEKLTLTINVPASSRPATRALAPSDEYAVNDVSVLTFDKTAKTFIGRYSGRIVSGPTHISGSSAKMTFEVTLPYGDCDLMIVANALTMLNSSSDLVPGTPQATVEESLQRTMSTSGWNSNSASPDYMPMWGYAKGLNVPDDFPITNAISLTRMVAKVDIQLGGDLVDGSNVTTGEFELQSVRVYNYVKQGRLIPYTNGTFKWEEVTQTNLAGNQIPSLPASYTKADSDTEFIDYSLLSPYQSLTNEIYIFEAPIGVAPAAGSTDFQKNTCLVVGGSYKGGGTTYYRIDFAKRSVQGAVTTYTYMPILRNNSYTITITGITGEGHPDEETALKSAPGNITTHILDWNNEDITTIVTDGTYMLGVSQGSFEFSSDARTAGSADNELIITTNHSAGWEASVWADLAGATTLPNDAVSGNPWMSLSSYDDDGDYPNGNRIRLLLDENTSNGDRTGYIHIKAGTLNYIVKVVQKFMYLKITDILTGLEVTDIDFASRTSLIGTAPSPRQFKVEWSPSSEQVTVAKTPGANDLTWNTSYGTTLSGGAYVFTIDPSGITQAEVDGAGGPFVSKSANLTFTLGSTGTTRTVNLSQNHYVLSPADFAEITATTLTRTASVKSNAPWSCTWTSNMTTGGMTSPTAQPLTGAANTAGAAFLYTFSNGSEGKVAFTFTPTDATKVFDPVTVEVEAVQLPDPGTPSGEGNTTMTTYVGAFWRADQRAERLIKMTVPSGAQYAGNWAVQVLDFGPGFSAGDIVFAAGLGANSADTSDPDTQGYYVDGGSYATGNIAAGGTIAFRIGLRTKWSDQAGYATQPVRYARVVVSFGTNYQYNRVIYIRQGHDADYLMNKTDGSGNNAVSSRPLANKYLPYNSTVPEFKGTASATHTVTAPLQPAANIDDYLTAYPSQAGAFYQWGPNYGPANGRYAFNPANPTSGTPTSWTLGYTSNVYWNTLGATTETCPAGYRRPKDTQTENAAVSTGAIADSEQRQSLWYNPVAGTSNNIQNCLWGFLADGFFDRRPLATQASYSGSGTNAAVSTNNSDVAYIGMLFYNPIATSSHYNANIFFPAAGYRYYNSSYSGYLYYPGAYGYYWSSSANSGTNGWNLYVNSGNANQNGNDRANGFSVRCVSQN